MSGLRTLSRLAFLVKSNNCAFQSARNMRSLFPKSYIYTPQILRHTATRSIWSLCHTKASVPAADIKFARFTKTCGCCGLHTAGDQELSDFLTKEIQLEKKSEASGQLPKIQGFEVTRVDGADVVLSKKYENEEVVVKFNVNHTVDDDAEEDFDSTQTSQPSDVQMSSRPPFVVEITKGEDRTLALQCSFPPVDDMPPSQPAEGEEEAYVDLIEIQEVALLDKSQEWNEEIYAVSGSIMDGNLYDMLLNMLEERGIDGGFVDQLIEFSTAYEQKKYVGFLEQLKDFVGCAK